MANLTFTSDYLCQSHPKDRKRIHIRFLLVIEMPDVIQIRGWNNPVSNQIRIRQCHGNGATVSGWLSHWTGSSACLTSNRSLTYIKYPKTQTNVSVFSDTPCRGEWGMLAAYFVFQPQSVGIFQPVRWVLQFSEICRRVPRSCQPVRLSCQVPAYVPHSFIIVEGLGRVGIQNTHPPSANIFLPSGKSKQT